MNGSSSREGASGSRKRARCEVEEGNGQAFSREEYERIQTTLAKKLGPEFVSSRNNGAMNVVYLEGAKAISLANEIFGFNGWNFSLGEFVTDYCDVSERTGRVSLGLSVVARITLRDGAFREDIGYGIMENARSKGAAYEKCKKEAVTDALKRALRQFGNALGNCLYDNKFTQRVGRIRVRDLPVEEDELYRASEYRRDAERRKEPPTTTVIVPAKKAKPDATEPTPPVLPPPHKPHPPHAPAAASAAVADPPIKTEEEALRERERESLKNNLQSADFLGSDDMDDYELPSQPDEGEEDDVDEEDGEPAGVFEQQEVINPVNEKNESELLQFVHGSQAPVLQEGRPPPAGKFDPSYQTPDIKRTITHDKSVPIRRSAVNSNSNSNRQTSTPEPPPSSNNSYRSSPVPPKYQNPLVRPPAGPAGSPMVGTPKMRYYRPPAGPLSDKGLSALNTTPLHQTKPINNDTNNKTSPAAANNYA